MACWTGALGVSAKAYGQGTREPSQENTGRPIFHLELDKARAAVPFLSWDTEGGERAEDKPLARKVAAGAPRPHRGISGIQVAAFKHRDKNAGGGRTRYRLAVAPDAELIWTIDRAFDRLTMTVAGQGSGLRKVEAVEMLFPFDPQVTPTTIIPQAWDEENCGKLPAVISSPDFGQMRLEDPAHAGLKARLEGSRKEHTVDLILEFPAVGAGETYTLHLAPVHLPAPVGLVDKALWQTVRRGWFNPWQPSSRWGEQDRPFSAPAGILSNNVISDPVSFALPFYADQALWTPEIAPGISMMTQVRRSIEWWLDHRMDPTGEVIGYWDYRHFLDSNPGILISAWDYVEATDDHDWLAKHIDRLEFLSRFVEGRDVDHDGMVEATQSGNYNTLKQPARSCCWWTR